MVKDYGTKWRKNEIKEIYGDGTYDVSRSFDGRMRQRRPGCSERSGIAECREPHGSREDAGQTS